jgi:hypothetical protein
MLKSSEHEENSKSTLSTAVNTNTPYYNKYQAHHSKVQKNQNLISKTEISLSTGKPFVKSDKLPI